MISPNTFKRKSRDLERWVSTENHEIKQKRAKVQDTAAEIGQYLQRLEKEKAIMLDMMKRPGSEMSTPRAGKRPVS